MAEPPTCIGVVVESFLSIISGHLKKFLGVTRPPPMGLRLIHPKSHGGGLAATLNTWR